MRVLGTMIAVVSLGAAVLLSPTFRTSDSRGEKPSPVSAQPVATLPSPAGSEEALMVVGPSYDKTVTGAPTGSESQSKVWFAGGAWWGLLLEPTSRELRIHQLDWETQTWTDTGVVVDERPFARPDVLWDGEHLYVLSSGSKDRPGHALRMLRFTALSEPPWYALDRGFPVPITDRGVTDPSIEKDTAGVVWLTYILDDALFVTHTTGSDTAWRAPYNPPIEGTSVATDQAAIVSFDQTIGLMWSNQNEDAFYFAVHTDGAPDDAWEASRAAVRGLKNADDHVSIRSVEVDGESRVFAVVKTSLDAVQPRNGGDPQILVLARQSDGSWVRYVVARVRDGHTRPVLSIDPEHRTLYVFLTSRRNNGIYYKSSPMDRISFPAGEGVPFIAGAGTLNVSNATGSKEPIDSSSGLVVLASDDSLGRYAHGVLTLGRQPVPTPNPGAQS